MSDDDIVKFLVTTLQVFDAYKQGHSAALADLHPADCPFDDCVLEIAWRNGWCDSTLGVDLEQGLREFKNMSEAA